MVFHIKIAADKKEEDREKEIQLLVQQSRPSLELNSSRWNESLLL